MTLTSATATAPTITTQPVTQTVVSGSIATFTVAATGSGTLTYQWYFGRSAISGATADSYTIATITSSSAGTYCVVVSNAYGSVTSSKVVLTLTEPFAAYLAANGLSDTDPATDSDGDSISNLVEFVLDGNPIAPDTSILPIASHTTSGGTTYLVHQFYTVPNLGSATWTMESSTDLRAWTMAVNGTSGVTITTTAYNASYNYTVATIPNTAGGSLFARLRATLPSNYTGTVSSSSTPTARNPTTTITTKTKTVSSKK